MEKEMLYKAVQFLERNGYGPIDKDFTTKAVADLLVRFAEEQSRRAAVTPALLKVHLGQPFELAGKQFIATSDHHGNNIGFAEIGNAE